MNATARAALLGLALAVIAPGPARAQTYPVTIKNNCGYTLYVLGTPQIGGTPYTPVAPGHPVTYQLTAPWISGRIYGCWNDVAGHLDDVPTLTRNCGWVEMTLPSAAGNISSNISYVDYISIPIKIAAQGGTACVPSTATVATSFSESAVQQGCPTKLAPSLTSPTGDKACMSAFHLCVDADGKPGDPSCSLFDSAIQTCTSDPTTYPGCSAGAGTSTPDVYGCRPTTFWSLTEGQAFCMAMNRGILPSWNNQTDPSTFYPTGGTFNAYASFFHKLPGAGPVFALPYDDYPSTLNEGGYVNCQASSSYSITFCNSTDQARRVTARGTAINSARPGKDKVVVSGRFASPVPIDLSREKVSLEAVLSESATELVEGRGPGRVPLPIHLFRQPGAGPDFAEFATADGVAPRAHLEIRATRPGRFAFSLSVHGISIEPPAGCATGDGVVLATRFALDTAALDVVNEEEWSCGNGSTYRAGK